MTTSDRDAIQDLARRVAVEVPGVEVTGRVTGGYPDYHVIVGLVAEGQVWDRRLRKLGVPPTMEEFRAFSCGNGSPHQWHDERGLALFRLGAAGGPLAREADALVQKVVSEKLGLTVS